MQLPKLIASSSLGTIWKLAPDEPEQTTQSTAKPQAEPPRPLMRELPPADPFPVEALGDLLGAAAVGIQEHVQCPMAIAGQSVLGASTLVAQAHCDIELPTGEVKPLSNLLLTVAATGERKTAADNEALWPVHKHEKALREAYEADLPIYVDKELAWKKAREHAVTKAKKGGQASIQAALKLIGPAPTAPLTPLLTCPEPTYEGLCRLLAGGYPSIGIFSSEGGQFIGGHGMTDEAKLRTAGGLSDAWDGKPIKRVRGGDGITILPGRRVAVHLMAQPDVAMIMLADQMLLNQGLLSRCLVSAPASTAGTRLWREASSSADAAIRSYGKRLLDILEQPLPLVKDKPNELDPPVRTLAADAQRMWTEFYNTIERQIGDNGPLSSVRGFANKLAQHAARIAAVLSVIADADSAEVSSEQTAAGTTLAQYYLGEALRLFEASQGNKDLLAAQRLLAWLLTLDEAFVSLPDIYQRGPYSIRDKATAARLVAVLEDHGWLSKQPGGANIAGQHRRDAWRFIKQ